MQAILICKLYSYARCSFASLSHGKYSYGSYSFVSYSHTSYFHTSYSYCTSYSNSYQATHMQAAHMQAIHICKILIGMLTRPLSWTIHPHLSSTSCHFRPGVHTCIIFSDTFTRMISPRIYILLRYYYSKLSTTTESYL